VHAFLRRFASFVPAVLLAVAVGSIVCSAAYALFAAIPGPASELLAAAFTGVAVLAWPAFLVGLPVALLYGAPLYCLSEIRRSSSYPLSAAIGAGPGLLLLLVGPRELAVPFLFFGPTVALLSHAFTLHVGGRQAAS
jgi:hypothetical protein